MAGAGKARSGDPVVEDAGGWAPPYGRPRATVKLSYSHGRVCNGFQRAGFHCGCEGSFPDGACRWCRSVRRRGALCAAWSYRCPGSRLRLSRLLRIQNLRATHGILMGQGSRARRIADFPRRFHPRQGTDEDRSRNVCLRECRRYGCRNRLYRRSGPAYNTQWPC